MRTGAIFARGSCRALKWVVLLGVLSVLGSAQAAAQAPMIESASYETATSRELDIKMSRDVFFSGTNPNDRLAGDFALTGGTITTALVPIRIDGLPLTIGSADDEFTLVFREDLSDQGGTGVAPLLLTYTQDTTDTDVRILSENRDPLADQANIVVTGPDQSSALRYTLTDAQRMELEKPRKTGSVYATELRRVGQPTYKEPIMLPRATGVPATTTVAYALHTTSTAAATRLGLSTTLIQPTATNPPMLVTVGGDDASTGAITNALPTVVGDWELAVTATVGTDVEVIIFTIKVAEEPDTPAEPTVAAAGPSSLKVTWAAPAANNSPIIGYELQYKSETASWPADAPNPANDDVTRVAPSSTHTISGLAPGTYDVRVRAVNYLDGFMAANEARSAWSPVGSGSTGAGPGTPTLTLDVDETIPEGRNRIPVKVTADVPPSALASRSLKVTLTLGGASGALAADQAELPNTNPGIPSDLAWAGPVSGKPRVKVLTLTFASDLSSEGMAYLTTSSDDDAENEKFRITASTTADAVFAKAGSKGQNVTIEDAQDQVYELELPVALASSGELKEGHGDEIVEMSLVVSPARTVPTSFFVSLTSEQDASDYSLTSRGVSSGGPTAVSLRLDVAAGDTGGDVMLTSASNDGDRVDDTITLQVFETSATSPTTAGDQVGEDIMLKVVDQHKLPAIAMGPIMVDGAAVTSLTEGETGTVTLMAPRGTATDDVPDDETITVTLTHGAASSASAADYSLSSETVTIAAESGTFMLEVLADDEIDAEELVLQGAVTGEAMYGDSEGAANNMVDVGPISLMDGTMKLVYPKTDEEIQAVIYPAKEAGMGGDMTFNPGEMIEITSPGSLFNSAEGVTLSFSAMSDHDHVATTAVSGGMVTVTAGDEEGMAHITITAHASMPAGAKGLPQTDPSEASIIFPVEVGLEALSFTLTGPEEMNLVEGGMGGMVTAMANRAVTADVTINLMRDRGMSTADDMDYTAEAITIEAGMMSGTTMVMATADEMMENEGNMAEELVLYGMAADNAGEVTGQVKFYIWDAAVPALPIIAQLLLAAFLAIGGYRRYRRR